MKVPSFLFEKLSEGELRELHKWLSETQFPEHDLADEIDIVFDQDPTRAIYYRDCPDCIFLGNYKLKSLYYCTNPKYAKTIVHETNDLVFGVRTFSEDDEWYIEAENRAMLRGLLPGLVEKGE